MKNISIFTQIFALSVTFLMGSLTVRAETGQTNVVDGITTSTSSTKIGATGPYNAWIVTNAGVVQNSFWTAIGHGQFVNPNGASNNSVLVTGSGSLWTNTGEFYVGLGGSGNQLVISGGGRVVNTFASIGTFSEATNNSVLVTGSGSCWVNTSTLKVGDSGGGSQLTISNGGRVETGGESTIGAAATSSGNTITVTGSGSFWTNVGRIYVANANGSSSNQLIVSGGGHVVASGYVAAGNYAAFSTTNNKVVVTGGDSLLETPDTAYAIGGLGNIILVENGGTLQTSGLYADVGVISNSAGIYQFRTATPAITTTGGGTVVLNNGTVSFLNITDASVFSLNGSAMTFLGNNTFRLNAASNAVSGQDYTFNTGLGATNYTGLEMINGATAWRGGNLTIGGGGTMLVSNTTANVAGLFSNQGTVRVVNSRITWQSNVVVSGLYFSDPSTNTFNTNLTVTSSGYLQGGAGDLFVFERSFINQSTQSNLYDTLNASVLFTNGGAFQHVLENTGLELGGALSGYSNNFAIGTLTLASGDLLRITGGVSNALYVGVFDLGGGLANTNNLVLDINVYYDPSLLGNAYLGGGTYDLTGTGMLIAIPEPSALAALGFGIGVLALLARRRGEKPQRTPKSPRSIRGNSL